MIRPLYAGAGFPRPFARNVGSIKGRGNLAPTINLTFSMVFSQTIPDNSVPYGTIPKPMVKVTLYYKEGCWLCDTAEEMLNGLTLKYDIHVNKKDIESDDELYEQYRFDIPVFEFKDGSNLYGRIKKKELINKLKQNRE